MKSSLITQPLADTIDTVLDNTAPIDTTSCHVIIDQNSPLNYTATVVIPVETIDAMIHHAALIQQTSIQTCGFEHGQVPLEYIKTNFKESIIEHIKEFLLKHTVIPYLRQYARDHKLCIAGNPRLTNITIKEAGNAEYRFEFTTLACMIIDDWKYFPFKSPKRKNYKDLDRQVESFIAREKEQLASYQTGQVSLGDWVNFTLTMAHHDGSPVAGYGRQQFWFKLSIHEGESPIRETFVNRQARETFFTKNEGLQDFFSTQMHVDYSFSITIDHLVPYHYFCVDLFKSHFRLKTAKEVHQKFIEVFSFRQDICLRRAIVEETLKLLITKHRLNVPSYLVEYHQQLLLTQLSTNPDYHVYRAQKDFKRYVQQLAERQARELVLIDQLAYFENITVTDEDIKAYLNLTNRPRTKEFIYFSLPAYKLQGQEIPISNQEIIQTCLREKTLNYAINRLTRR